MRALRTKRLPGLPGRINEALVVLREQRSCPNCQHVFDRVRRILLGAPTSGVEL